MQEDGVTNGSVDGGQETSVDKHQSPGSVVRSLQILERLSRAERGFTLTELSRSLGSPKSTTLKLLRTLHEERFVTYSKQSKIYMLGPGALALAELILDSPRLRVICRPHLERLCEASYEDAYLGVQENDYIIYIDKVEGRQSIRLDIALGTKRYLHSSAVGKLFLAQMDQDSLRYFLEKERPTVTANTLTDPEVLREELEHIRHVGISVSQGENIEGITAIAAPIWDADGTIIAGISVSGPSFRLKDSLDDLINLTKDAAGRSSEDLLRTETGERSDGFVRS